MSEFLKFAFELISQIIYNLVQWVVGIVTGFVRLFFGIEQYDSIRKVYFQDMGLAEKAMSILLIIILIAIPVLIVVLIIKRMIINARLRVQPRWNVFVRSRKLNDLRRRRPKRRNVSR